MISYLSSVDKKRLRGTALLRLDFNTEDDWRMEASLHTVKFLLKHAEKIIVAGHKGRPDGFDKKLSLRKDARRFGALTGQKIVFVPHFRFGEIKNAVSLASRGTIFLLENLRFLPGEEKNDLRLAEKLSDLADFYVNDAFAVSHRADASVAAIVGLLPGFAGLDFEREMKYLSRVMEKPRHPLVFILGGSKAEDKLGIIRRFGKTADSFLLGGAAANTALFLRGFDIGASLADKDPKSLRKLKSVIGYGNIVLPCDYAFRSRAIFDIGPGTAELYTEKIRDAGTIIWSGPLGFIEKSPYDKGSLAVARAIAGNKKAFSLAGGGETVMFLKKHKLDAKFSFISTGGGAMLDFLAGEKLPGIEALKR